ncbi:Regulator of chromosome condensation (RCC1) family with FYVE zinc finger domain [Raphanus sativus]|nr:Regulator of chromosome condensation (RCC1) family with FYVE zinc finger domain [Raphanus sativus]
MSSPPATRSSSPLHGRSSSPYARRSSPPRTSGFSRSVIDSLKKTNEVMNQEMTKLQSQVKNLKEKCNNQRTEVHKFQEAAKEAFELAAKQSSKHKAATEALKSVAEQLKGLKDKLPPEVSESEAFESINSQAEAYLNTNELSGTSILTTSILDQQETSPSGNTQDQKVDEQTLMATRFSDELDSVKRDLMSIKQKSGGLKNKDRLLSGIVQIHHLITKPTASDSPIAPPPPSEPPLDPSVPEKSKDERTRSP